MRIVLFVHSVVSDWSHGNAHFLRGLGRALAGRGHRVTACEPVRNWATENLYRDHGQRPLVEFGRRFPHLDIRTYGDREDRLEDELGRLTRDADLVLVHEFNEPELVRAVGHLRRRRGGFRLLFHDTHHRAATEPEQIARLELGAYDGILAFGESLAEVWRRDFGQDRVWTFHEAADTPLFHPRHGEPTSGKVDGGRGDATASVHGGKADLPGETAQRPDDGMDDVVWIGNWGDDERSSELRTYLVETAREMPDLRFVVHGVRYPEGARRELAAAGIEFRGWIPNFRVPEAFARARMTVHIPRGPYLNRLPGIPTIRPFEALACGIPMISTPWRDVEGLFRTGRDYVVAHSATEMRSWIRRLASRPAERDRIAASGLETIHAHHTCRHRAEELEAIAGEIS